MTPLPYAPHHLLHPSSSLLAPSLLQQQLQQQHPPPNHNAPSAAMYWTNVLLHSIAAPTTSFSVGTSIMSQASSSAPQPTMPDWPALFALSSSEAETFLLRRLQQTIFGHKDACYHNHSVWSYFQGTSGGRGGHLMTPSSAAAPPFLTSASATQFLLPNIISTVTAPELQYHHSHYGNYSNLHNNSTTMRTATSSSIGHTTTTTMTTTATHPVAEGGSYTGSLTTPKPPSHNPSVSFPQSSSQPPTTPPPQQQQQQQQVGFHPVLHLVLMKTASRRAAMAAVGNRSGTGGGGAGVGATAAQGSFGNSLLLQISNHLPPSSSALFPHTPHGMPHTSSTSNPTCTPSLHALPLIRGGAVGGPSAAAAPSVGLPRPPPPHAPPHPTGTSPSSALLLGGVGGNSVPVRTQQRLDENTDGGGVVVDASATTPLKAASSLLPTFSSDAPAAYTTAVPSCTTAGLNDTEGEDRARHRSKKSKKEKSSKKKKTSTQQGATEEVEEVVEMPHFESFMVGEDEGEEGEEGGGLLGGVPPDNFEEEDFVPKEHVGLLGDSQSSDL